VGVEFGFGVGVIVGVAVGVGVLVAVGVAVIVGVGVGVLVAVGVGVIVGVGVGVGIIISQETLPDQQMGPKALISFIGLSSIDKILKSLSVIIGRISPILLSSA
tara:strand:- start:15 stop:326 length:312 start_codon:yes stop_codon:yes gene_type:complete